MYQKGQYIVPGKNIFGGEFEISIDRSILSICMQDFWEREFVKKKCFRP